VCVRGIVARDAEGRQSASHRWTSSEVSVKLYSWLSQPLTGWWCFIGWLVATIVFVAVTAILGGPVQGDSSVSVYSTWSIAHGHLSCAYSPRGTYDFPAFARPFALIAPLYPLLSGAVLGVTHATNAVPFPTSTHMGTNCSHAFVAIYQWALHSNVIMNTIRVGYLMWLPLMVGAVLLLRALGRGRTRWEPTCLVLLAILPPVLECLLSYFHPQDLLAIGLALCSLAFALRGKWVWAGVMLGLAFTSNQFALLVAVPLVVIVPSRERVRFVLAGLVAATLIVVPMAIVTSGRSLKWSLTGSGFSSPSSAGGTLLRDVGLSEHALLWTARVLPIAFALLLALWAKRRLGSAVLKAVPLLSLVATALALRLVFEVNLWGYYFAASAVLIVITDVAIGRIRGTVIAWLALFTLAYNPVPWGFASNGQSWGLGAREVMPTYFALGAVVLILFDVFRHRLRWYLVAWFVVVLLTLVKNPYSHALLRTSMPNWFWQVVLVPITIALAISPLLNAARLVPEELNDAPAVPNQVVDPIG
jgi:hypothetical protein